MENRIVAMRSWTAVRTYCRIPCVNKVLYLSSRVQRESANTHNTSSHGGEGLLLSPKNGLVKSGVAAFKWRWYNSVVFVSNGVSDAETLLHNVASNVSTRLRSHRK